jgi:hypothetical protein
MTAPVAYGSAPPAGAVASPWGGAAAALEVSLACGSESSPA